MFDLKNGAQRLQSHMKTFCFGGHPKISLHKLCRRKYSHKKLPENFGQVWGNSDKIFRTPKNLHAPTPVLQAVGVSFQRMKMNDFTSSHVLD